MHGKIEAASHNDSNMNSSLIGEGKILYFWVGEGIMFSRAVKV